MIENLHTLRGRDCEIAKGIILRQPKLSEIEELGEEKYSGMLAILVSSPFDMIAELDKLNIDFTKITSFQLFCVFYKLLDVKETKLLFGDLDFSKFRLIENNGKFELRFYDTVINEKIYKDNASAENTLIKEMMHSLNINEFSTNAGTAKITEQTKETFIEDALIEFLKKNDIANDIVKTKEYDDFDALESAIYHEKISQDLVKQMTSCKETKTTTVLRISKKKGE